MFDCLFLPTLTTRRTAAAAGLQALQSGAIDDGAPPGAEVDG